MASVGRAWVWWAGIGTIVAAGAITTLVPSHRLEAELAAARKEGIWTSGAEVRQRLPNLADVDNAAPLAAAAISLSRKRPDPMLDTKCEAVARGRASHADASWVRKALSLRDPLLQTWRAASEKPRLDFHRRWEQGYMMLLPELAEYKRAGNELIAAARVGIDPQKNLRAAARLSALLRQDPLIVSQTVSTEIGRRTLAAAKDLGFASQIEPDLGAPMDVRYALSTELPSALASIDAVRTGRTEPNGGGLGRVFVNVGPVTDNRIYNVVHLFRLLWKEVGDHTTDYDRAAKVVDLRLGQFESAVAGTSPMLANMMSGSQNAGQFVRDTGALEAERRAVRRGRP